MRKLSITLIITFFLFSFTGLAKWIAVSEGKKGTIFVDPNAIKANGTSRFVWQLYDFTIPQYESDAMSMKFYTEIECDLKQYRTLKYATYGLSMGEGDAINIREGDKKWISIKQNSYGMDLLNVVCLVSPEN